MSRKLSEYGSSVTPAVISKFDVFGDKTMKRVNCILCFNYNLYIFNDIYLDMGIARSTLSFDQKERKHGAPVVVRCRHEFLSRTAPLLLSHPSESPAMDSMR